VEVILKAFAGSSQRIRIGKVRETPLAKVIFAVFWAGYDVCDKHGNATSQKSRNNMVTNVLAQREHKMKKAHNN